MKKVMLKVAGPSNAKKKARKNKKKMNSVATRGNGMGLSQRIVSDGLNSGLVTTNNMAIVDKFPMRREKIADIFGFMNTFRNIVFPGVDSGVPGLYVNPGNSAMFPIFSEIAKTYEEWSLNHCELVFETQMYTAAGNGASAFSSGMLCQVTNYNPNTSAFRTLSEAENYIGSTTGPPYARQMRHKIDPMKNHNYNPLKSFYVNSSNNQPAPSDDNAKFYDLGLYQLCQDGMPNDIGTDAVKIGELFVEFSFTMYRPKQGTFVDEQSSTDHLTNYTITSPGVGDSTATDPLGSSDMKVETEGNFPIVENAYANHFDLPQAGRYIADINWQANGNTITTTPTISGGSNVAFLPEFNDNHDGFFTFFRTTAATIKTIFDIVESGVTVANRLTIGGLAGLTSGVSDALITRVASTFGVDDFMRGTYSMGFRNRFRRVNGVWQKIPRMNVPRVDFQTQLTQLERQLSRLLNERGSVTDDDDWKCRETNTERWNLSKKLSTPAICLDVGKDSRTNSSSSSSGTTKLSDSVVNLIAEKLRK